MDGITHINVYSRGKTEIGRFLSNFSYAPFTHPIYGDFNSVEGFWYWYLSKNRPEILRTLYGAEAKKQGRLLTDNDDRKFILDSQREELLEAMRIKLRTYPKYWRLLVDTGDLPFMHYYVLPGDKIMDLTKKYQWIMDEFYDVRNKLREYENRRK